MINQIYRFTLLAILLSPVALYSQVMFQKVYGGTQLDQGHVVRQTANNTYTICGYTTSFGIGGTDGFLLKTDLLGTVISFKTIGTTTQEQTGFFDETTAGSVLTGTGYNTPNTIPLIKTDGSGNVIWSKELNLGVGNDGNCVRRNSDQGFILVGHGTSMPAGYKIIVARTDSNGVVLWGKLIGGGNPGWRTGASVQQTSDGGFIVLGESYNLTATIYELIVIKMDGAGNIQWSNSYVQTTNDNSFARCIRQTSDNGYMILGSVNSGTIFLLKLNSAGVVSWSRSFSSTTDLLSVNSFNFTNAQGLILAGHLYPYTTSTYFDGYLIKTDSAGSINWARTYGGVNHDSLGYVEQTPDGGYISVGFTSSFGIGYRNVYLIKTDANGYSGCNDNPLTILSSNISWNSQSFGVVTSANSIISATYSNTSPAISSGTQCFLSDIESIDLDNFNISASPVPNSGEFDLTFDAPERDEIIIEISDLFGRIIRREELETHIGKNKIHFNLTTENKGVYLISIRNSFSNCVKKVVIQ